MMSYQLVAIVVLNIVVNLLVCLPSSLYIGLLTQRLSYKNYLKAILKNEVWNSAVKIIIAALTIYATFKIPFLFMPDVNPLTRLLLVIVRIIAASMGAMVGSALQPVAITGGIACGKSTVIKVLREKQKFMIIIDLNEIAHEVFHHPEDNLEEKKRNNILSYSAVFQVMMIQILNYNIRSPPHIVVAVDIPLFFETGQFMRLLFGLVVVIACSPSTQVERLRKLNPKLTAEQCHERIESQIPILNKVQMADLVIWNNGSLEELGKDVEKLCKEIQERVVGWQIRFHYLLPLFGVTFAFVDFYLQLLPGS